MAYEVLVLPSAERELDKLPPRQLPPLVRRIELLGSTPRPVGVQKLRGSTDQYRIRNGNYRILYRIDDRAKRVFVYAVGHRKDVYR